jgi:hypothetical protein
MPERHNNFQDLMASIHQQLASPYQVAEPEMLPDSSTGQEREVDLVIRSSIAGYEIIISVECTDSKQPVSVEWVEQMCCKHNDLSTHKLVLISESGYTEAAHAKALALGAELLSLEAAKDVQWTKFVDRHAKLFVAAIDIVAAVVPASPTYASDRSYQGILMQTEFLDPEGQLRETAGEIAHAILSKKQIQAATIGKMDATHCGGWEIHIDMQPGVRMRLPDGSEHAVEELKVIVPMLVRFDLERASFRDGQVAYGTSQTKYGEFLLSILEVEGNAPGAQVRIRGPWGEVQSYDLTGSHNEEAAVASDEAMRAPIGKRP